MKAATGVLIWLITTYASLSQGTILFDTHVPGIVDSKWAYIGNEPLTPFGPDMGAQLSLVIGSGQFFPLAPITSFKAGPASELGYVVPVIATAAGYPPGTRVQVSMAVFPLRNPVAIWGSSDTFLTLGGGGSPPAYLTGLPSIMVAIPEPSMILLAALGTAACLTLGYKRSRDHQATAKLVP